MNTGYKHRIRDKEMIKTVLPRTSFMYSFFTINTESVNITFSKFTQYDLKTIDIARRLDKRSVNICHSEYYTIVVSGTKKGNLNVTTSCNIVAKSGALIYLRSHVKCVTVHSVIVILFVVVMPTPYSSLVTVPDVVPFTLGTKT